MATDAEAAEAPGARNPNPAAHNPVEKTSPARTLERRFILARASSLEPD